MIIDSDSWQAKTSFYLFDVRCYRAYVSGRLSVCCVSEKCRRLFCREVIVKAVDNYKNGLSADLFVFVCIGLCAITEICSTNI